MLTWKEAPFSGMSFLEWKFAEENEGGEDRVDQD